MIRNLLLAGVAAASLTSGVAVAQTPRAGVPAASAQNRAAATPQPTLREILDRDVGAGRLTEEQAAGIESRAEARVRDFDRRAGQEVDTIADSVDRIGRERGQALADARSRGPNQAGAIVEVGEAGVGLVADAQQGVGRLAEDLINIAEQIARDRADQIGANPNATPSDRAAAEQDVRDVANARATVNSRTGAAQYRTAEAQRIINERRTQIVDRVQDNIDRYGPDPRNWPTPPPPGQRAPGTPPPAAAPAAPSPAPAQASATPPPSSGGGRRGTIPPADPYAGLRVPQPNASAAAPAAPTPPSPPGNAGARGGRAADAADNNTTAPGNAGGRGGRAADAAGVGAIDTSPGQAGRAAGRGAGAANSAALQNLIENLPRPGRLGQAPGVNSMILAGAMILATSGLFDGGAGPSNQTARPVPRPARDPFARPAAPTSGGDQNTAATLDQQRRPATQQPRQPGGPDYPQARPRLPRDLAAGARNGDFGPGDSFGGALAAAARARDGAAPPDAVDVARNEIAARSDRAMAAWDRLAASVYYDENGVLRRRPTPAPTAPGGSAPRPGRPRPAPDPTWESFERGGSLQVAELEPIYEGWDINTAPPGSSGRSLSAAGTSLSAAPNSMRMDWTLTASGDSVAQVAADRANGVLIRGAAEMGLPLNWGAIDFAGSPVRVNGRRGPPPGSLADILRQMDVLHPSLWNTALGSLDNPWSYRPLADSARDLARALYGPLWSDRRYRIIRDPTGRLGEFSPDAVLAGFTDGLTRDEILRILRTQGIGGLNRLLAQPFNVLLTWGAGAFDVDLHMTGPSGTNDGTRFHIFYAATGSLDAFPFAQLIRDCICRSGSEVILTTRLNQGGVYRISAFNFGNQSTTSTQLSTDADLRLLIVRGGAAVSVGNGTTIQGGTTVFSGSPTPGRPGNTWVGVEIDPRTGQIRFVNRSDNSVNGDGTASAAAFAQALRAERIDGPGAIGGRANAPEQ